MSFAFKLLSIKSGALFCLTLEERLGWRENENWNAMVDYSTNNIQSNQLYFVILMFFVLPIAGVTQNDIVFCI